MNTILDIRNVTIRFGGLIALNDVSFKIDKGSIYGLIGPNGAGKSTLINAITGIYKPDNGTINFNNQPIHNLKTYQINKLGITRTFQTLGLFPKMTVLENLMLGIHNQLNGNVLSGALWLSNTFKSEKKGQAKAMKLLERIGLQHFADRKPTDLPFGHCKLLELSRALFSNPKILLLDEPTSGLSFDESKIIEKIIVEAKNKKATIFVIEHNIPFIKNIADKLGVLNFGVKIAEGNSDEVLLNSEVIRAYIGEKRDNVKHQ